MTVILMYGDTITSPYLRHALPLRMFDPIVFLKRDNAEPMIVAHAMEMTRLEQHPGIRPLPREQFGYDDLVGDGVSENDAALQVLRRACADAEVTEVTVPPDFPLEAAHALALDDVSLTVDRDYFEQDRRRKSASELAGVGRAQDAADHAMESIAELLRSGRSTLTAADIRRHARREAGSDGQAIEIMQVLPGAQAAIAHIMGEGPISPGESLVVDIGVHDEESGSWTDMTRTFCIGPPPDELVRYHRLCVEAIDDVYRNIRAGVTGHDLHSRVCDIFEQAGYPTERTKGPGEVLKDGFYHLLGHGVGLEIHEPPSLGLNGEALVAGDVVAVEPALYRSGFGGCRVEDTIRVTEDGAERLTNISYELSGA